MSETRFQVGQRIRTTVDAPAGWEGAFAAPAGSLGTIDGLPGQRGSGYGVLIDGDPDGMPLAYDEDELAPA